MDRLDNPIIPRRGTALLVEGSWTDAYPGAKRGFPAAEMTFEAFHQLSNPGSLYFITAGGTTFGRRQTGCLCSRSAVLRDWRLMA
jgi:hypothetical protein